jgi:hypothetical protein
VFIGYSKNNIGYKCLHIPFGRVYIARHVVFNENSFPSSTSSPHRVSSSPQTPSSLSIPCVQSLPSQNSASCPNTPSFTSPNSSTSTSPSATTTTPPNLQTIVSFDPSSNSELASSLEPLSVLPAQVHGITTRSQNQIYKPYTFTDARVKYPPPQALIAYIAANKDEPTCFSQASKHLEWRTAMNTEFDALLKNGTWSLVPFSPSMNIVGSKWVFKIKRKANTSNSTRLV